MKSKVGKKPTFWHERRARARGYDLVIGVDEVGRGALAGPVVAGAVAITNYQFPVFKNIGIDDSKRLTVQKREELDKVIRQQAAVGIGEVGVGTINKIGIVKATEKAMRSAITKLIDSLKIDSLDVLDLDNLKSRRLDQRIKRSKNPDQEYPSSDFKNSRVFVLVDAFHIKYISGVGLKNQQAILKGDQKVLSIAAASIIAKVHRDKVMQSLSKQAKYKNYQWAKNKGYGTTEHRKAIKKYGITRFHRLAFVKNII